MPDYSRYEGFKVEKKDKVAVITLNRPEQLNSFNAVSEQAMASILEDIAFDDEVNAAVLTGAGRVFSTGGDIKGMEATARGEVSGPQPSIAGASRLINGFLNLEKPLIAAVNGHAIGLGAQLALFCDVIFAAEQAKFGDPHVKVGLVAGDGGAVIWPLLIGPARAKQYLMTGDLLDAKEAERIGLINKALPAQEVMPAAMALAQRLANGPSKAINWTKVSVNQLLKQAANTVLMTSLATEFLSMHTPDHVGACRAFLEKRDPKFTGQ